LKFCLKHVPHANVAIRLLVCSAFLSIVRAQTPPGPPVSAQAGLSESPAADTGLTQPPFPQSSDDRIFGVVPNYLTVENPQQKIAPLTVEEKFKLFAKETFDPFTFAASAAGAALSQIDNDDPKYGHGAGPYAQRFGAAIADITTQNFFSDAVLASVLHEDPRYFRRGPEYGFWYRVGYALSRVAVTRTDSGNERFNYSGILGMSMGIALSNAYYPDASVSGREVASRFGTSLAASALSNILPEFWPDIHQKFFHHKPHPQPHPPTPSTPPTARGG
jgi:hypothetical protein